MLSILLALAFLGCSGALVVGLIRPGVVLRWGDPDAVTRGGVVLTFGAGAFLSLVLGVATVDEQGAPPPTASVDRPVVRTAAPGSRAPIEAVPPKPAAEAPERAAADAIRADLADAEGLWREFKRSPAARNRWSHDWNRRLDALRKRIGQPDPPTSSRCDEAPACTARFHLSLALVGMYSFWNLRGDAQLRREVEGDLKAARKAAGRLR